MSIDIRILQLWTDVIYEHCSDWNPYPVSICMLNCTFFMLILKCSWPTHPKVRKKWTRSKNVVSSTTICTCNAPVLISHPHNFNTLSWLWKTDNYYASHRFTDSFNNTTSLSNPVLININPIHIRIHIFLFISLYCIQAKLLTKKFLTLKG